MKGALTIAVICFIGSSWAFDCSVKNKTHNYFYGKRVYNDRMVFMSNPKHDASFMRTFSTEVTYPISGSTSDGNITYIEVLDQMHDGTGGCAFLTNGGVGQDHVSFHVKSQRGKAFNFLIRLFATPKRPYGY